MKNKKNVTNTWFSWIIDKFVIHVFNYVVSWLFIPRIMLVFTLVLLRSYEFHSK